MAQTISINELAPGMSLLQAGQLVAAEQEFLRLLKIDQQNGHIRFALGITCYQLDRLQEAEQHFTTSISLAPSFLPAYNNLALVHKALGAPDRGIAVLKRVLEIQPGYVDAIYNLGLMQEESNDRSGAMQSYRRVVELKPDNLRAHTNLGLLLRAAGDVATAHRHLDVVATMAPKDDAALVNLALVLTDLGRYAEAISAGIRATQLSPDSVDAWEALGNAQRLAGDASSAVSSLKRAHVLQPTSVELQYELGLAQTAAGELEAARATLDIVAQLRPDWLKVQFTRDLALPALYLSDQHIADCNARYAAGIGNIEARLLGDTRWPVQEAVNAISGYAPFYLHYQGLDNTALQRRFGRIVGAVTKRAWPQYSEPVAWQPRTHGGRLRVGFISAYLCRHSVGHFFCNWICQLDATQLESFVWYTGEVVDDVSEKIHRAAAHYSHVAFDTAALAAAIHACQLDVLIYLDVGMHPQSQVLAALRLAPIQCATFGHPATTGIENIDYFLSADAAEPENAAQHYTERLIRLPRFAVSYPRPEVSGQRKPPALANLHRPFVFCAQPLFKILPHFDHVVARIARELPGCKLAFMTSLWPRVNEAFLLRISGALRAVGIDPEKTLQLLPIMPYEHYLGTLAAADVVLDTQGFSGGNSSFDALAVGAPIVSWRGEMLRGRQTAAMLDIVGLPELASETDDEYVRTAISLASSRERQAQVHERMHAGSAALFDDIGAIRALERTLLGLLA